MSATASLWFSVAFSGRIIAGVKGLTKGTAKVAGRGALAGAVGLGAFAGTGILAGAGKVAERVGLTRTARFFKNSLKRRKLRKQTSKQKNAEGKYGPLAAASSDATVMDQMKHGLGYKRGVYTKEALKRGLLRNANTEKAKRAAATLDKFGYREDLAKLYEQRPGLAPDPTKAFAAAHRSGENKKFTPQALKDNPEATLQYMEGLASGEKKKYYDALNKPQQNAIKDAYLQSHSMAVNPQTRESYAKLTGDLANAFKNFPEEAAAFVPKMKPKDITSIDAKNPKNIDTVADRISESQLSGLALSPDLTGDLAKKLKAKIQQKRMKDTSIQNFLKANPFWANI